MIASWFANAIFQIAVGVLALLGIIAMPIAIYEEVEINGISLFGWHISDGLRQKEEDAARDYNTALGNQKTLQAALDKQNAAVNDLKAKSDQLQEMVSGLVVQAEGGRADVAKLNGQLAEMRVDHSSAGAAAVSLDEIIQAGAK